MTAGTFGGSILAGTYRDIHIIQHIHNQPDSRTGWIKAAVLRTGVKPRTGDLAGAACNTFVKVDLDFFYYFSFFLITHRYHPLGIVSLLIQPKYLWQEHLRFLLKYLSV